MTDESIAAEPRFLPVELPDGRVVKMRRCDIQPDDLVSFIDNWHHPPFSPEVLRASSGSLSEAEEHTDLLQRLEHFVSFLCGAAEIDGVSFGDRHPEHKGGFWWRTPLRSLEKELFAALSPSGPMISLNAVAAEPSGEAQDQSTRHTQGGQDEFDAWRQS